MSVSPRNPAYRDRDPRGHGEVPVNQFYLLKRPQTAGIFEVMTGAGTRVLRISDSQITKAHRQLVAQHCPVFRELDIPGQDSSQDMTLLLPEGTRDVGTILGQPMDEGQRREVLLETGRALRSIYEATGLVPVGDVTETMAFALGSDEPTFKAYLVPPYAMAAPDVDTLSPLFFTDDPILQQDLWEGWSDGRIG